MHRMKLVLNLTNKCNFRCKICLRNREKDEFVSFDLVKPVLDQVDTISFTGGEACLHPKFDHFIEEVTHKRIDFGITTNGYLDRYRQLVQNPRLSYVMISIDGTKHTHDNIRAKGSFDRAIASVRYFSKHRPTTVQMVVNKLNINEIEAVRDIALKNGALNVKIQNCIRIPANESIVLNKDERYYCRDMLRKLNYEINVSFWENRLFRYCPMWNCINPMINTKNQLVICCDLMEPGGTIDRPFPELIQKCRSHGIELKKIHRQYLRNNTTELSLCDWCNTVSLA